MALANDFKTIISVDNKRFVKGLGEAEKSYKAFTDKIGKTHYTVASIPGPFTIAGEVRGVEDMLYDSVMNPDFVVDLLKRSAELGKEVAEFFCQLDVDALMVCDPTTSGDLLSVEDFERFSQVHLTEVGKVIKKAGKEFIIHMCGSTEDRLQQIADTGCEAFSCDKVVDIPEAIKAVGNRIAIVGNLDPTGTFYSGTPDQVMAEASELIQRAGRRGYLLGVGCDIPVGAKLENIQALYRASISN